MRSKDFYGYTIYEDGSIYKDKRKLHSSKHKGKIVIRLTVNNKRQFFTLSRLLYWLFVEEFDYDNKDLCVSYKDSDGTNINLDNLYLTHRKNLIQGVGHRITKLTEHEVNAIKELYEGKAGCNQHDKKGLSYNDLAKLVGVTKGEIAQIIKGTTRNKENYKLK